MRYTDDITGRPLIVSNQSTRTIVRALVAAHREGVISDTEYKMTYAEVCEPGYFPQAFGGKAVPTALMDKWQQLRSWANLTKGDFDVRF